MTMQTLYDIAATTRQAFHYWKQPSDCQQEKTPAAVVLRMAKDIRKDFLPGSSAREIFHYIRTNKHPQYNNLLIGWGKHHFESLCLDAGMRIEYRRFVPKTTVRGDYIFPNRIEGADINDINRIWVSDITYLYGFEGQLLGYATSLIDLYSRRLLGLSFSQTMHASVTSRAILEQAFKIRTQSAYPSLIFHSDGGKQYIEKDFLALLRSKNIDSSMAESCYENAFAESFNDLLKNHLMVDMTINSFTQLKKLETFIKHCYNFNRPHGSLNKRTPVEFELSLATLPPCQRTLLLIKATT